MEVRPIISVKNLFFSRDNNVLYKDLSLDFSQGKVTAILGPSGIGKTTLLKLIAGQLKPDMGEIWFESTQVHQTTRNELYKLRRKMGMLFQSGALFTGMSVFENVAFPLREHTQLPESLISTLVLMKLHAVGLRGAKDLMPSQLSGGMARRVALARAIALDPELVMYDEPFAGQDPISMAVLLRLIRELNDSLGLTSIIVSHDVAEVLSIADYVYVVADQGVIAKGTPDEIRANETPKLKQFIGGLDNGAVPFHYDAPDFKQDLAWAAKC